MAGKTGRRSKFPEWIVPFSIIAISIVISLYFLDQPIAAYIKAHKFPGWFKKIITFFDCYEQPVPLLLLVTALAISAGASKWRMTGQLLLGLLVSAIPVWIGKLLIARQRPRWFSGSSWYDSFTGFFPGIDNMRLQSFPSGDAAIAFLVSFILAQYFPKHRIIFYILAVGSATSRVLLNYHYMSDVIIGSLIGYLSARIIIYLSTPARS